MASSGGEVGPKADRDGIVASANSGVASGESPEDDDATLKGPMKDGDCGPGSVSTEGGAKEPSRGCCCSGVERGTMVSLALGDEDWVSISFFTGGVLEECSTLRGDDAVASNGSSF
jgi:hypothetical protein